MGRTLCGIFNEEFHYMTVAFKDESNAKLPNLAC